MNPRRLKATVAAIFIVVNFLTDLLYGVLDPRLEDEET